MLPLLLRVAYSASAANESKIYDAAYDDVVRGSKRKRDRCRYCCCKAINTAAAAWFLVIATKERAPIDRCRFCCCYKWYLLTLAI